MRRISSVNNRTAAIGRDDILLFVAIRNETDRLTEFLEHYRKIGVRHFLIVDNDSTDGSAEYLARQPDVSLWRCPGSYRSSRFGMDWIGALLMRYGHGHWCVTVDADELLIYPEWEQRNLQELTAGLDAHGVAGMGALMLELYPSGPLGQADAADTAPLPARLPWFDPGPYRTRIEQPMRNRIVQGGVRERVFFPDNPGSSPTLNKLPLIRWHWRYTYVNSTHSMLPSEMNDLYDGPGDKRLSGVLLHAKFITNIIEKTKEELVRRQHFIKPERLAGYHYSVIAAPVLLFDGSQRYNGWQQLVNHDLMGTGTENSAAMAVPSKGFLVTGSGR